MTVINVYDMNFNLIGVIDTFKSIIWRPAYYGIGDFEIYTAATEDAINLLQENRLVVKNEDTSVDGEGNALYKNVMIIKNIELKTNVNEGDFLIVTGRELKFILHQRIVWQQTNLTGTAENGIRRLVNENAISPKDSKRKFNNLILGPSASLTDRIEKQLTGQFLDEAIVEICTSYNYGWDIFGYNNSYVFILYQGLDRSYNQSIRPYVVFSDRFDNLYNTDYQLKTEGYATTALVGGEGEGTNRIYSTVNDTPSGLDRYEMFVDAKDLSSNKGSENEIPQSTYIQLLQERGNEKLAEATITEGFSGEVLSGSGTNYEYGLDFDLGDIVTVINSYGISKNVRVLSSIESEDETGKKIIPQFNF